MGGGHVRTPPVHVLLFCPAPLPLPPPLVRKGDARRGVAWGWQWRGHTPQMGGCTRSNRSMRMCMPLLVPSPPLPPPPHQGARNWEGAGPLQMGEGAPRGVSPPPSLACAQGQSTKGSVGMGSHEPPLLCLLPLGPLPASALTHNPLARAPHMDPQAPTTHARVHTTPQDPCTPACRPTGMPHAHGKGRVGARAHKGKCTCHHAGVST